MCEVIIHGGLALHFLNSQDLNKISALTIHGSINNKSQDLETTKMSINGWMDFKNDIKYSGILFTL